MANPGFHILIYDWLQPLLQRLREKGLPVSPDTHLQVLKVLQLCGEKITDGESLFHYLSPVLAKNGEQVKILQQEIRGFLEEQFPDIEIKIDRPEVKPGPAPVPPTSKFTLWASRAFMLIVVAVFLFLALKPRGRVASATIVWRGVSSYKESLMLSARKSFDHTDMQYVQCTWDFGDGTIDSSDNIVSHTYKLPGTYKISLHLRNISGNIVKIAKADTQIVAYIPKEPPAIISDKTEAEIGEEITFSLQYDAVSVPAKPYSWYVNDTLKGSNVDTIVHRFSTSGPQRVRVELTGDESDSLWSSLNDPTAIAMIKTPSSFAINLSGGTNITRPDSHVRSAWLWLMGILTIVPAGIALYIQRKLAKKDRESKARVNALIGQFNGRGAPWEIPFKNHDELVEDEQGISQLSKLYKRRSQTETYYLNIPQTIASTIRSEGLLQTVYSSASRPLEFLILIDKTKAKSQQVKLFEYLVSKFSRNDIYLEKFYFQSTPEICTNANHPNGIHISRLHDLYSGHTLIIFGNGYQFLEPLYPALKDSLVHYYKKWNSRAICTPVSYTDWNYREKLLQRAGAVFPADLKGQLLLFRVLEQSDLLQDDFKKYIDDAYAVKPWNFSNTKELSTYLDNPFLYQWLCALAVYPQIDWNVMVAIGDALQAKHFRSYAVNYSSLLRLVRIAWMAEGSWPDNLRLQLLKDREPAHEKTARETMVRILEEALLKIKPSSAVYENVQTQLIINKFLLHAHDPANPQYEQYALEAERFKNLWEQEKIMDTPLAEYLQKPVGSGSWSTLIHNNELSKEAGESLTIDAYLKDGVHVMKKKLRPMQKSLFVTSLFSISALTLLITVGAGFRDTGADKLLKLTESDNLVTVQMQVGFNNCFDSARMHSDSARLVLHLPAGRQVELNAGNRSRSFQMPYHWTDSLVMLSVKSSNAAYVHDTLFKITSSDLVFGITGCPPPVPSCDLWSINSNNAARFQEMYGGDWYEVLTVPDRPGYEPIHIEPGYINGKRIVETYTCPNDTNNVKMILDNEDGTFQVAYMRTDVSPDNLSFAFIGNRFRTRSAAQNDASTPQPVMRQRFGSGGDVVAASTLTSLQGRWISPGISQNGGLTLATSNGTTTLTSYNQRQTVLAAERSRVSATLTWYKLMVQDAQLRSSSIYVLQFDDARVLASEEIRAPKNGVNRATASMGIFYPMVRADASSDYVRIEPGTLPASLTEIWQGGSSNRFLNINLANNSIHYAVGSPGNSSSFSIWEVYRRGTNNYKLVSSTRSGLQVMFLRNVASRGFEYSLCEKTYRTSEEVEALDESYCNQFNTMTLYYPPILQRIQVPVDGKTYTADMKEMMKTLQNDPARGDEGAIKLDSISVYINTTNTTDASARLNLIKSNSPLTSFNAYSWNLREFGGNRFERDYIIVSVRRTYVPNCSVTYHSIDETKKLSSPLVVCRLDLSSTRLSSLPREVLQFTNLQYLNLGETTIPDATLDDLRKRFSKLDLRYSRAASGAEAELLSITIRSDQFTAESEKKVYDIAYELGRDRKKKVRIEGDFYTSAQRTAIQTAIKNTTALLYKNKVSSQQVLEKLNDKRKEQGSAGNPTLRIIGINFDGPSQSTPPRTN